MSWTARLRRALELTGWAERRTPGTDCRGWARNLPVRPPAALVPRGDVDGWVRVELEWLPELGDGFTRWRRIAARRVPVDASETGADNLTRAHAGKWRVYVDGVPCCTRAHGDPGLIVNGVPPV